MHGDLKCCGASRGRRAWWRPRRGPRRARGPRGRSHRAPARARTRRPRPRRPRARRTARAASRPGGSGACAGTAAGGPSRALRSSTRPGTARSALPASAVWCRGRTPRTPCGSARRGGRGRTGRTARRQGMMCACLGGIQDTGTLLQPRRTCLGDTPCTGSRWCTSPQDTRRTQSQTSLGRTRCTPQSRSLRLQKQSL